LTGASRQWGVAACVVAVAAGWARVWLGVHFPVDVLVSAPVGLLAALAARGLLSPARLWVTPVAERAYDGIIGRLRFGRS
jgi:membrane-associated phospholipid phosphatase